MIAETLTTVLRRSNLCSFSTQYSVDIPPNTGWTQSHGSGKNGIERQSKIIVCQSSKSTKEKPKQSAMSENLEINTTATDQPSCVKAEVTAIAPNDVNEGGTAEAVLPLIDIAHFAQVKLRVGEVLAAEALPKSKKLLKLKVSLGALGERQILAGIAQFLAPQDLVGRRVVVVANLQPATLMGHQSEGMLLAASAPDHSSLSLIDPGTAVPVGSEVC